MRTRTILGLTGKGLAAAILTVVIVLVLASMWIFGWGAFSRATADYRGETAQTEAILADPNYRIAAYEHFFDLCAAVQTAEASIKNLEAELATGPSEDRVEQLNASITALRNSRADSINQYNVDAAKAETAAHFRASDLPYQLDINSEETTCTA